MGIKEKILESDIVSDNDYLDRYVELINSNITTEKEISKTNVHHIIPKYYYKNKKIPVDNSNSNTVNLLFVDHIKAHYLLAKCSICDEYVAYNVHAIRYILNGKDLNDFNISDVNLDDLQEVYERGRRYTFEKSHSIEACKKVSDSLIGRQSPNKGNFKNGICASKNQSRRNINAKNKKLSDYACERIGEKNPFYGKTHTDDFKLRMSIEKGFPVEMVDVESGEVINHFPSASSASKFLYSSGIVKTRSAVNRILTVCKENDQTHKAYGYNWRFSEKV